MTDHTALLFTADPEYHSILLANGYQYYYLQDLYINPDIHTILEPVCKNTIRVYYDTAYNKIMDFISYLKQGKALTPLLQLFKFDKVEILSEYKKYPTEHQWIRLT